MEGKREVERSPESRQEEEEEQRGRLHQPQGEEEKEGASTRNLKQETTGCGRGHTEGFMY